jgi:hypothetical protein
MTRRISLPGADELFRATGSGPEPVPADVVAARPLTVAPEPDADAAGPAPKPTATAATGRSRGGVRHTARTRSRQGSERRPSGRERHEEKITVYLSPEELVDLEQARLSLRQEHGLAVDRGRIVREALALILAELDARGDSAALVRRLRDS